MKGTKSYITDLIGIDLLRFVLSLIVVVNHYYFFYFRFEDLNKGIITSQPYYHFLSFFYKWGYCSVQVFWLISGLIFHCIYYEDILTREINFGEFVFLRFTRLYPLHFVTLLFVAILQYFYFTTYGNFFMCQAEDFKHLALQLFYMGSWYPHFHHSYNIPAWSVSVEVFVYIIFFVLAVGGLIRNKGLHIVILVTIVFNIFDILDPFAECMTFFFCGCLLGRFIMSGIPLKVLFTRYAMLSVLIILIIGGGYFSFTNSDTRLRDLLIDVVLIGVCSMLILFFIIVFRRVTHVWWIKFIKNLGNMTYSMYMVHFPIQLAIYMTLRPKTEHIFDQPLMLIIFVGISLVAGWVTFHYFEKPVQKYLRLRFSGTTSESIVTQGSASGTATGHIKG